MKPLPYRARRVDTNKWVYGWHLEIDGKSYIYESIEGFSACTLNGIRRTYIFADNFIEVHPSTVTQSTGRKDKHGVEIYGGMRVSGAWQVDGTVEVVGIVTYYDKYGLWALKDDKGNLASVTWATLEIIPGGDKT